MNEFNPRDMSTWPVLLTRDDMATILGYAPRSISRKLASGELPNVMRMSGGARWARSEVVKWLERNGR